MGMEVRALVQFRVLGALEATRDGAPVRLGGERQRALLALLLIHANQLVSTERLVGHLFGEDPPGSAANAVHVAVSRLRRSLQNGGQGPLRTRPGGYVLELEPDQLDASRFERMLAEGRSLRAAGEPDGAAARLRDALALWRGAPLADVGLLESLQPEVRRLEELRRLALIERLDAELALGRHAELIPELEALVASEPLQERLRGLLMLALYRSGRQADALAVYRQMSELMRDELGLEPSRELRELERMVLRQEPELTPATGAFPGGGRNRATVCPFKGLSLFDAADAEFFCGRDRIISDLVARLAESTLVGILGPSGIGKSSLLRAGVLPALRRGALPRSHGWRQVVIRPGQHPTATLDRALGGELQTGLDALAPGERIVIAVDQLEELFTACPRDQERSRFLHRLADAARDPDRRVLILCALRADFYGRLSAEPRFAELLSHSHVLLGPMDREELAEAIEQPAQRAGLVIERPLVDSLVAEVAREPGGLPLLSTTLLELWQARDGHTLRFESYRALGGVHGAVSRLAEAAYGQLDGPQRLTARALLLRLVTGEDETLARRRVALGELEPDAGRVLEALVGARLLTVGEGEVELSHEALMREWPRYRGWLEEDRAGRRLHAHLIAAAREWTLRDRDPAELYRGARLAGAQAWAAGNQHWLNDLEREFLEASRHEAQRTLHGQRVQRRRLRSLRFAAAGLLALAILAGAFALIKQHSATNAARAAAADARAALSRQLGAEAVSEPRLDLAMLLAREAVDLDRSPQTEGTLLATVLRSPAVIGSFTAPAGVPGQMAVSPDGRTLAISDQTAGRLEFVDTLARATRPVSLDDYRGAQAPTYSPDGSLLVYPGDRNGLAGLVVRDAHTLALTATLQPDPRLPGRVTAAVPAGPMIAPGDRAVLDATWVPGAGGRPGEVYLDRWSLPDGRLLRSRHVDSGPLLAARLIDGGARVLTVSTDAVRTWTASSLRPLATGSFSVRPVRPSMAAVSADGGTVAIGSGTGAISFIDPTTGRARRGLGGHRSPIAGIFFTRGGSAVATVGQDDTATIWNPRTATAVETLSGPTGQVQSATATRDGATLYTSSLDGELLSWDLTGTRQFRRKAVIGRATSCCSLLAPGTPPLAVSPDGSEFAAETGPSTVGLFSARSLASLGTITIGLSGEGITALAWSPARARLAVAGHSGLVQVWDVAGRPRLVRTLVGLQAPLGRPEAIQALAFSPNGTLLAATDRNETRSSPARAALPAAFLAIWSTSSGRLTTAPRDLAIGPASGGSDPVAFSPRGRLLAVGLPGGRILIIDPLTGKALRTLTPASRSTSLAFSPAGTLATGTAAGTVELWNPAAGRRIVPALIAASAPITSIAFDPSGQRFATAGDGEGAVRLWFTSSLQPEGPVLSLDPGDAAAVSFLPSGADLLAVGRQGAAYVWPASLGAWERRACAVAGRTLSRREWERLVAEPRYSVICR